MRGLFWAGLGVLLLGCGSPERAGPPASSNGDGAGGDGVGDPACEARFVEGVEGACVAVTVTDIREEEVSFERDGFVLHGTLSFPVTAGAYRAPAAVLVHGSGPNDRDQHLPGSLGVPFPAPVASFASLARQLSHAGLVVLRYDKRSCFAENNPHCPTSYLDYPGDLDAILVTDFAEDARAAARMLAQRPEVRPDDVVLVGHSEGGLFVPRLVTEEASVSAGIGLAGPALSLADTLGGQLEVLADYLEAQDATLFAEDIDALRAQAAEYRVAIAQIEAGTYPTSTFLGVPVAHWADMSVWFDDIEDHFASNDEPLLLLSGDADFNIWPEHLETYEAWAASHAKPEVETWLVPGLTHGLVPIVAGEPPLTHEVDAEVPAEVVAHIRGWLAD